MNVFVVPLTESYGLRAYKCDPVIWDGDENCQHEWGTERIFSKGNAGDQTTLVGTQTAEISKEANHTGQFCLRCGAWRGVLGMEPTPQLYIQHLVGIFDLVRRVLKPTGTMFINISDSYAGSGSPGGDYRDGKGGDNYLRPYERSGIGVPSKSLIGIPARFQLAMIEHGFVCRNDIIWWKRSCMPESVSDRFTRDFEHIFFFSNQGKYYFEQQFEESTSHDYGADQQDTGITHGIGGGNSGINEAKRKAKANGGFGQRNKRTVWDITSGGGTKFEHYASYPVKLCETPIKAGCPEYICPKCGKARERVYKQIFKGKTHAGFSDKMGQGKHLDIPNDTEHGEFIGYSDCGCGTPLEDCVPGVVLDPFSGTFTTSYAAKQLGRKSIGIEASEDYCKMGIKRLLSLPGVQSNLHLE